MDTLISKLSESGPIGILAGLLVLGIAALGTVCVILWRHGAQLSNQLYQLSMDKVRQDASVQETLRSLVRNTERLLDRRDRS